MLLLNFAALGCNVLYLVLVQVPDVLLAIGGPLPFPVLCHLHLLLKNFLAIMYVLEAVAISVTKYVYIFIFKNPSGKNDDIWCFVYNLTGGFLTLLYQAIFLLLPGKNPYLYYICCNEDPRQQGKTKVNVALQVTLGLSLLVYIFVVIKINLYRQKHFSSEDQNLKEKMKDIIHKFVYVALSLTLMTLVGVVSAVLNATDPENLSKTMFYNLIQFHLHWIPFFNSIIILSGSYGDSKKLRLSFKRDFLSLFKQDLTNVQSF